MAATAELPAQAATAALVATEVRTRKKRNNEREYSKLHWLVAEYMTKALAEWPTRKTAPEVSFHKAKEGPSQHAKELVDLKGREDISKGDALHNEITEQNMVMEVNGKGFLSKADMRAVLGKCRDILQLSKNSAFR